MFTYYASTSHKHRAELRGTHTHVVVAACDVRDTAYATVAPVAVHVGDCLFSFRLDVQVRELVVGDILMLISLYVQVGGSPSTHSTFIVHAACYPCCLSSF